MGLIENVLRAGIAGALAFVACGCASVADEGVLTPPEAVFRAAGAAPAGVHAIFVMPVRAAGRDGGRIYLNSERDYRDQRNLSISIGPRAAAALAARHGAAPDAFFPGRRIRVTGAARRVRIDFRDSARRPTGLYYFQTHVDVESADQIALVGGRRSSARIP